MLRALASLLSPLLLLALLLELASCIVVPISPFTRAPYPPEVLQKLAQPGTTRNQVRATLGPPQAVRAGGRYWFYGNQRESVGIIAGTGSAVFEDFEWVGFEFEPNGRVVFMEHNDDAGGCLSNGICTEKAFLALAPSVAILTAPTVDDTAAKTAPPPADACQLFIYPEAMSPKLVSPMLQVKVDGKERGVVDYHTYLLLTHPPGSATIKAGKQEIIVPCRAAENQYIHAVPQWPKTRDEDIWAEVVPVDAATGQAAVQNRKRVLPF